MGSKKKKFDIVLQNPPYGQRGAQLHLEFIDKLLEISNIQVVVMPFSFITKLQNKNTKKYKYRFSKYLTNVEEINADIFNNTEMDNVAIYEFINNKSNDNINIQYINKKEENVKSLLDLSSFTKYEYEIIKYLSNNPQPSCTGGGHSHCTKQSLNKQGIYNKNEISKKIAENITFNCRNIPDGYIYLTCALAVGGIPVFIGDKENSHAGTIFESKKELINSLIKWNTTSAYNFILFNSITAAENCKCALKNSLLRFTLHKLKEGQIVLAHKCYKYIPNIDWNNDKVKTDYGLLELCGCPKNKINEYVKYCDNYIKHIEETCTGAFNGR